jgi:hypothetical protein
MCGNREGASFVLLYDELPQLKDFVQHGVSLLQTVRIPTYTKRFEGLQSDTSIEPYIHRRDLAALEEFETANHNTTGSISSSDPSVLFSANTSCILSPEVTIGPYYVLGEFVRQNVTEGQPGVPVHLEMQFIDVNTCEPAPSLLINIRAISFSPSLLFPIKTRNCTNLLPLQVNSTGVYSGMGRSSCSGS